MRCSTYNRDSGIIQKKARLKFQMGILDSYRDRNANSDGFMVDFYGLKEKELIKRAMARHTR